MDKFFEYMYMVNNDFRRGEEYRKGMEGMRALIERNPSIVDTPSTYAGSYRQTPLWEAVHLMHNNKRDVIVFLLENGARNLDANNYNEPTLIQAIHFAYPMGSGRFEFERRYDMIKLIEMLLGRLSPEELRQKSSTGETPYMVAVRMKLPERITNMIRDATGGTDLNRNIYGRTVAYIKKIYDKGAKEAAEASKTPSAGGRRKSRRNRKRSSTRRRR